MSDNQFGPPQPGFGPPQPGAPIPPQGAPAPQPGYGYPQQQPQQAWGGGAVPPQEFPPGAGPYPPGYPAPPKKSRKGLWITLGVVAAVVLGGAGVVGYLIVDTASKTGTHKVVLPQTFHDMTSDPEDETTKALSTGLQRGFENEKSSFTHPEPVSTIYRSSDETKMLLVSGASGNVLLPSQEVDATFDSFTAAGTATVSDRSDVDAGPLGGRMSCGSIDISGQEGGICVWSDNSSVVLVLEIDAEKTITKQQVVADTQELRKLSEVPK
ncbi:hypothetical protein [Streptomyces sp. TLI_171]|uniref:hypothetical protein n=1 Tax=Streptomyces sp. TLI_171 TaxID=1938859 RepID=UPI000C19AA1F|nr:hypothetical protein [Streptomyces sp. TLI_171]RKE19093.1 hypothetical protein BX266_2398 [Streptomyces sp. TLI_171]